MKIGKVSEPVLKRSVLKYLKPNNDYVITGAAVGADCALFSNIEKAFSIEAEGMEQGSPDLETKKSGILAATTASVSGEKSKRSAAHAIYRATNNLAAGGTVPFAVQLHIMLPERYRCVKTYYGRGSSSSRGTSYYDQRWSYRSDATDNHTDYFGNGIGI